MSRSRADLKRRAQALSTNNRGFTSSARFSEVRENLNDEDDEDVRLETYRTGKKVEAYKAIAKKPSRGMKMVEILEDSPNGYEITKKAPPETERAVKYYSFQLRQFTVTSHPEEYGLIHYSLGKVFFKDRPTGQVNYDLRAKNIENALHHFRIAGETFDYDSHPFLFGVINIFIGQLFRERATLISNRSLLARRGVTVNDCCNIALAQLLESQSAFQGSAVHCIEYCLTNLEVAWVYVVQLTEAMHEQGLSGEEEANIILREQALLALDRAQSILDDLPNKTEGFDGGKPRSWDPLDPATHPEHIRLLLQNQTVNYVGGMVAYLHGRLHQDWSSELEHQEEAFGAYSRAVKPSRLPLEVEQWVDAHHRAAEIAVKYPKVIDPTFGDNPETDTDLCCVSAVNHLTLALTSPCLLPARRMDILFHLAQANIARLNMIMDRVPEGKSLIKALSKSEGLQIMRAVEGHLVDAMRGSTAANTQSTQDAFIYYFSCLKLSEFRMLQAAAETSLSADSRAALLEDAIAQLVNALLSRSMIDNLDLHYVATAQMAQMLLSSHRDDSAAKWYGRTLLCCSAIGNRVQGAPIDLRTDAQIKFWDEGLRISSLAVVSASLQAQWQKLHLGPLLLTEAPTSGYAYWSMEMNLDPNEIPVVEPPKVAQLTFAEAKAARQPPSALIPHTTDQEKQHILQKTMLRSQGLLEGMPAPTSPATQGKSYSEMMREEAGQLGFATPQLQAGRTDASPEPTPPVGAVPLWALGQAPNFEHIDKLAQENRERAAAAAAATKAAQEAAEKAKNSWFGLGGSNSVAKTDGEVEKVSPYAGRRRHLVPNMYLMISKVTHMVAEGTDRAVFLMPQVGGNNRVQFKVVGDDLETWAKKAEAREKQERSKGLFGGFFSLFTRKPVEVDTRAKATGVARLKDTPRSAEELFNANDEELPPSVPMWATQQCYFMFCALSRLQRHQLVLRANNLRLTKGERAQSTLSALAPEMAQRFQSLLSALEKASRRTAVPPQSLRELSQRSFADLQSVFQSHVAICRINSDIEVFLFKELSRFDDFIPMITCSPSLTRDITTYDPSLFDAGTLVCNLQADALIEMNTKKNAAAAEEKEAQMRELKKRGKRLRDLDKKAKEVQSTKKMKNPNDLLNEVEGLNRLRYGLAQSMDGSGFRGGSREMLAEHLGEGECMLLWHYPNVAKQKIHLVLVWRENSRSKRPPYNPNAAATDKEPAADQTNTKRKTKAKPIHNSETKSTKSTAKSRSEKGIVMEMCKTEVDAAQLGTLVNNYVDALHSFPASHRTSYCNQALRSLSAYLAFSEVLHMVPTFIDTFVIMAPPLLRLIPWHLLLVEYENPMYGTFMEGNQSAPGGTLAARDIVAKGKIPSAVPKFKVEANLIDPDKSHKLQNPTIEEHLMERYLIRLGPTLPIYELCENAVANRANELGMHRMSAIDGESLQLRGPGLRASHLEVECVKSIFSGDPDDIVTMQFDAAAPKQITTSKYYHISKADREKAKLVRELRRKQREVEKKKKQAAKSARRDKRGGRYDSSSEEEEEEEELSEDDSESEASSGDDEAVAARSWLREARVVHWAANRVPMLKETAVADGDSVPRDKKQPINTTKFAAVAMPQYFNHKGNATSDTRTQLNSADFVAQVHFRNCGLLVLSRFGIADGTGAPKSSKPTGPVPVASSTSSYNYSPYCNAPIVEANCEFVEAAHLAGATTVMYPMWSTFEQGGLSTLSTLIFLIKFYSELPIQSRKRHSILHAVRNTQLWMREQTADQVIAWLGQCPLPNTERLALITELELYVKVSDPTEDLPIHAKVTNSSGDSPLREPTRPGAKKFFAHWLQWGAFALSGHGGGVHPEDLTEENEDVHKDHLIYDETLNNIHMEIMLLKKEGRYEDARLLQKRLREMRIQNLAEKARQVKHSAILAARAVNDMIEAVDRALLDQDDDEIEVGHREEDELERMKVREARKQEKDMLAGTAEHKSERELAAEHQEKLELKRKRVEEKAAKKADENSRSYRREIGPLLPGGGSQFLANITGNHPQIEKLAKRETPITKLRGFIESLFPVEQDDDYVVDQDAPPGSPTLKIKPRKFIPIEAGSAKMRALELQQKHSRIANEGDDDEPDEGEQDRLNGGGPGKRKRRVKEKTAEELAAEERALERKNEREIAMKGSAVNLLDLLPDDKSACTVQ